MKPKKTKKLKWYQDGVAMNVVAIYFMMAMVIILFFLPILSVVLRWIL